jgi:transposase
MTTKKHTLTLFHRAGWSKHKICRELKIARSTVRWVIGHPETPPKPKGRPPICTTPIRKRLVARATINAEHRRKDFEEIAVLEGLDLDYRTIRAAFEKERYFRRVAAEKPLINEVTRIKRLAWAYKHRWWTPDQWARVVWTDEASFRCGYFGQVYVTRRADEKYKTECLVTKFRKYSAWMIWGCITSHGIGPLVVFEKEWGKINGEVYCTKVLPHAYDYMAVYKQDHPLLDDLVLMEDNASIHKAYATRDVHTANGVICMDWPPNSPDLNPIENLWRLLKWRVGRRFPTTKEQVRQYVEEEWLKLDVRDIRKYVQSMYERCEAVIAANGMHTKW